MPKKAKRYPLLNGCYRTEIAVTPKNWHTKKASIKHPWEIWYRFHDPEHPDYNAPIRIRGMNDLHDLEQRQLETKGLIQAEIDLLDNKHFNPITKKYMQPPALPEGGADDREVTPKTGLMVSLEWAHKNIERASGTMDNIRLVLEAFKTASVDLHMDTKPIGDIERSDVRRILDRIGKNKGETWTANNFNYHKGHIGMLFSFLDEYDVFKINPCKGIKKKKITRKIREILSDEDFDRMDRAVRAFDPYFWRLIHIFKESSCRRPEMLGVEYEHVQLKNRRFKVLIKKDDDEKEVWKDITPRVYHLWCQVMKEARSIKDTTANTTDKLYLFSEGLRPQYRDKPISPRQITRRWREHVKRKLGITADLYSLRHRRSTKDVDAAIEKMIRKARQKAARKNNHNTTAMVDKVYDVNQNRHSAIVRKLNQPRKKKLVIRLLPPKSV